LIYVVYAAYALAATAVGVLTVVAVCGIGAAILHEVLRAAFRLTFSPASRRLLTHNDPTRRCRLDRLAAAWAGVEAECRDERCRDHHPSTPATPA
jgi:hypothetical protein